MDRVSLIVVWFILIMSPFTIVYADYQGDALNALKDALVYPKDFLSSWDNTLTDPSTWSHITWNSTNNGVVRVDISGANLSGSLVPELGNLDKLQYLEIHNNSISGSIPKELGQLTNLVSLGLYSNSLTGSIPEELGNLTSLLYLRLNDNNLSGRIPVYALSKLIPQTLMDISNNPYLCSNFTYPPCPN